MTPDPRFSLLYNCPEWLLKAYHNDPVVHDSLKTAVTAKLDDKETLLYLVARLLKVKLEDMETTFRQEYKATFWDDKLNEVRSTDKGYEMNVMINWVYKWREAEYVPYTKIAPDGQSLAPQASPTRLEPILRNRETLHWLNDGSCYIIS